jgi:hypothetical protein
LAHFFFSLSVPGYESVTLLYHMFLQWCAALPQASKQWHITVMDWTSKARNQNKLLLSTSWLSQVFVIMMECWLVPSHHYKFT